MSRTPGPGDVVAGRYRLEVLLRKGGMGSVFRATREGDPTPVAVKILDPVIAENPQMLGRFLREARTAAALESPNVVRIHEHGVENGNEAGTDCGGDCPLPCKSAP